MKTDITDFIETSVDNSSARDTISTEWGSPLVGFAAASDTLFSELKDVVSPTHFTPEEVLENARTVIAFFLPLPESVARTNAKGLMSSSEWARSYIETNDLIAQINSGLAELLRESGAQTATIPATHNWIKGKLISNWSHRHVAYIAGLGRFGLNNMLITEEGCCGRIGSMVTTALIHPDCRPTEEACLYKYDGSCRRCLDKCVVQALSEESFDRYRCYRQLTENVDRHKDLGYADVCGKCLSAVPCAHTNPVRLKTKNRTA